MYFKISLITIKMEAEQTANKSFTYSQYICGKTIDKWVQLVHAYNCKQNGWATIPLKKGAFGYDNLAICIGYVLPKIEDTTIEEVAEMVHEAWAINYIFWRDNEPFLDKKVAYHKPANKLGDDRRNLCAETSFANLSKDEQEKDIIIAKFFVEMLNSSVECSN